MKIRSSRTLRTLCLAISLGTTACLAPGHYLMTTTTAAAGPVMRHLEFVHQAHCADWDLRMISVTEHWAQFAVAGPLASWPASTCCMAGRSITV